MTTLYPRHRVTPDAIHAAAALNHLATTPPATARILELGCGSAARLVMHASAYPQSITIGIDVVESEIVQGQQLATSLECNNIELFVAGLADLLAVDLGEFDYIIIHQAFAQIGTVEREALLHWCQAHLAERGVVAIRWSVLPEATSRDTVGEALRFHLLRAEQGADLLAGARAMLSFMLMTLEEGALKQELLAAEAMDDATLVQTYLTTEASASTLSAFSSRAEEMGLQYLGDMLPQYEEGEYYGALVAQMIDVVSAGANRIMTRQYLDFAVQRTERFSLLCHRAVVMPPATFDIECLKQLHWAGNFIHQQEDAAILSNTFKNSQGRVIQTTNGVLIRVMELLGSAWPMSLSFEQLVFNCQTPETNDDIQDSVLASLKGLFMSDVHGLYWSASPCIYNQAKNNRLAPVALLPAQRPEQPLTIENLWGESVSLTSEEWDYLQGDMSAVDTASWECYSTVKMKGLIIGSTTAWKKHLQQFLRAGQIDVLKSQLSLLLLLSVNQEQGGLLHDEIPEPALPALDADAMYTQVNALINAGHSQQARDYAHGLVQDAPENMHALHCYARTCVLTSAWDEALITLCKLMGYYFSDKDIYYDLALVLHKKRQFYYARIIIRTLLRLDNKKLDYWLSLASLHFVYGNMMLAEKCCRAMLRLDPPKANYYDMIGIILSGINKIDEARYFLEKSVELSNYHLAFMSNLLFVMSHDATVSSEALLEKHLEYGRRARTWAETCNFPSQRDNVKDPNRKLRVGFVSGDLRNHPVANFLLPFWDGLDRDNYELVAYSTIASNPDHVSEHFRKTAVLWRQADAISDLELAKMIVDDGVDVLFDLAGHTAYNRLPTFALHPAPVQIAWIGYPGTTGLKEMDYRMLPMSFAKSPVLQDQLSEKGMFVTTRKFFEPHPKCPETNPLPALKNGYLTFGSFNRVNKLNDQVLSVWARLLLSYPESRLLIGNITDSEICVALSKRMLNLGISTDRLIYKSLVEMEEYLGYHHEIDILLDAFPYNGGTTTHHGAWMGVPTVTMSGPTIASLQGADVMSSYGLEQFIAVDEQDYINRAIYWRDHIPELAVIRQSTRAQISTENEPGFNVAGTFEKAIREAWQIYCRGEQPRALFITEQD